MSKFTPGPWYVSTDTGLTHGLYEGIIAILEQSPERLVAVHGDRDHILTGDAGDPAVVDANARLIAAAPVMYEAAKKVVASAAMLLNTKGIVLGGMAELTAAIAAAEGRVSGGD